MIDAITWTREAVADRIRGVWEMVRRERRPGPADARSGWPDVVRDWREAYGYNPTEARLPRLSPREMDRAVEAMGWFAWLSAKPNLTRALWLSCGLKLGPRTVGQVLGVSRWTAAAWRDEALDIILDRLCADAHERTPS